MVLYRFHLVSCRTSRCLHDGHVYHLHYQSGIDFNMHFIAHFHFFVLKFFGTYNKFPKRFLIELTDLLFMGQSNKLEKLPYKKQSLFFIELTVTYDFRLFLSVHCSL